MFKEERFVSGSGRRTGCQLNCLYHDEQSEEFVFTGYSDGSLRITPLSVGPKKIIDLGRVFLEAFPDDDDENYQLQAIHVSPTINPKELILIGAITPTVESSKDKPKGRLVFCRVDSINQLMALNTPKFFSLDIDWTPLRIERVQLDIKRKFQFLVSSLEGPVHFFNSGDFMGQDCKSDVYSLSNTFLTCFKSIELNESTIVEACGYENGTVTLTVFDIGQREQEEQRKTIISRESFRHVQLITCLTMRVVSEMFQLVVSAGEHVAVFETRIDSLPSLFANHRLLKEVCRYDCALTALYLPNTDYLVIGTFGRELLLFDAANDYKLIWQRRFSSPIVSVNAAIADSSKLIVTTQKGTHEMIETQ